MSGQNVPRLKKYYNKELIPKLKEELGITNIMQVPGLKKIVLNMGLGEAVQNPKALESGVETLKSIAGQKPVVTKARKSIATFKLRENMPIGAMVTLRGERMWEFLIDWSILRCPVCAILEAFKAASMARVTVQ